MKFFLMLLSLLAMAEEKDPKAVVEEIFTRAGQEQIKELAAQEEVNRLVDFEQMARASAPKGKIPESEFSWYKNTLKAIITKTVYPEAPNFLKDVSISYKAVEINGDTAVVHSVVKRKADLTDVNYKFKKIGGEWKVIDLSLDGESWVGNIKDQVTSSLKKKQWKGLKEALQKRLAKLEKK